MNPLSKARTDIVETPERVVGLQRPIISSEFFFPYIINLCLSSEGAIEKAIGKREMRRNACERMLASPDSLEKEEERNERF